MICETLSMMADRAAMAGLFCNENISFIVIAKYHIQQGNLVFYSVPGIVLRSLNFSSSTWPKFWPCHVYKTHFSEKWSSCIISLPGCNSDKRVKLISDSNIRTSCWKM